METEEDSSPQEVENFGSLVTAPGTLLTRYFDFVGVCGSLQKCHYYPSVEHPLGYKLKRENDQGPPRVVKRTTADSWV